jgi:2-dehydro-3-deoxyphosphogluconate aldolase/(4S)-4-hydroxy-2-oxoglutarate aldolase
MKNLLETMLEKKVIAIIRNITPDEIEKTCDALYAGGIRFLEIAFDHQSPSGFDNTLSCIQKACDQFSPDLQVGAGTVLTTEEVHAAKDAGATFIISPNTNPTVILETKNCGLISIPGALSATEAIIAHDAGADIVKIFPAGLMGAPYLKAIMAPLNYIRFAAVGNIDSSNIEAFLKIGIQCFGIGGNLVSKKAILEHNFNALTTSATELLSIIKKFE